MSAQKSLFKKGSPKTQPVPEENIAFLGKKAVVKGKIGFKGVLRLDGKFYGEIECGTLIVGEMAIVKGKTNVNTIITFGHVEGEIYARQRVEIYSTGKLYGTLITPIINISEGGIFEGCFKIERTLGMEGKGKKAIGPPRWGGVD